MLNKKSIYSAIFYLLLVGLGIGCQPKDPDAVLSDPDYFPLQTGDYWIYQVTSENYGTSGAPTKSTYQLQQKISDSSSQNGQVVYLIEESIKRSEQTGWQLSGIRTVYKNLKEVVSLERNVPIVRLTFPVLDSITWNINTYNANADTLLRYKDTGKGLTINNIHYNRTASVWGTNDSTLVNLERYKRIYAYKVGLVYSENTALEYCQSTTDCIGKAIIESGIRQKWELIESNRLPQ